MQFFHVVKPFLLSMSMQKTPEIWKIDIIEVHMEVAEVAHGYLKSASKFLELWTKN